MEIQGCCGKFFQRSKPYVAMISLQFGYAGMNIITKVSLNHGMSHYVLVVYRHAFATLSIAPFALILERKVRPKLTFWIFMQIFALGLLGPVIDQNFYYAGLKFTSPTFSCAMSNMLPAMTFVLAVLCRMEKVDLKKVKCQAKVVGTLVTVAGAMLMTLYKGPIMEMVWTKHLHPHQANVPVAMDSTDKDWFKGSIFLIIATLAWASLFILQAATLKKYDAPLSLTSLICFVGTLQAIVVTLVMERKPSVWRIGWDMNLLAAAYAGIVTSSIAYYVQGLVIQDRGPVFASAFSPLMMIIVAIMGSFILAEKIYMGGVLGAVLIVVGLYSVLWGKYRDNKEKKEQEGMELPMAIKGTEGNGQVMDIIEVDKVEVQKAKANNMMISTLDQKVVAVSVPIPESPMKTKEEP
ncbi:WAT1-related protein At5g07050 [Elaeis guineensis]|uniref:WAT1-related protein n=1 Tax=Elaeis guineensis var. tenera TaxID=51953 RepID=A0A6I9QPT5_ELAGV|nr:WAT1-related protein At5g07050 [Elaeis guineensis]XP_010938846.1 WAT1-related protein At5g07050 [Elaeis guineensis]